MPKRVYVRGHYRTYGRSKNSDGDAGGCIGSLALLFGLPILVVLCLVIYFILSNAAIIIPLILLITVAIIAIVIYRSRHRYRAQWNTQAYQYSQAPHQGYQIPYYPVQHTPSPPLPQPQFYTNIQQPPASLAHLLHMTPQQFEECTASVMRAAGLTNVQVVGKTGDDGIDITAQSGGDKIVAQCKRYSPSNKVGSADLRNFVGAMSYARAQKGWFITTSTFSEQAKRYASAYPGKIILLDGNDLLRCIQHYQPPIIIQQY